jgi:hypothetical protein
MECKLGYAASRTARQEEKRSILHDRQEAMFRPVKSAAAFEA